MRNLRSEKQPPCVKVLLSPALPAAAFGVVLEESVLGPETIEYRVKVIMFRSRERHRPGACLKADAGVCSCMAASGAETSPE